MSWRINILVIFLLNCSCQNKVPATQVISEHNYLIEANELITLIDSPNIKILDFRTLEEYNKGHIKGSLHITRKDIEDANFPYSGMMANQIQIENLFSRLGIGSNDTIVVYDNKGMCEASRLWWILYNFNFHRVKMLNGGWTAWENLDGEMTRDRPIVSPTNFRFLNKPSMAYYITKDELSTLLENNVLIIDSRTFDEYSGLQKKNGAFRAGRIPNSIHIDWAESINFTGDQRLKSIEELKNVYDLENIKNKDLIILYCHSGVRSAHTTFVITQLLGFENVKNYDGSWVEWSYFNHLPIENDTYLN